MWIYRITHENDVAEIELRERAETETVCPDCGLHYPARLDYDSGNSFFHYFNKVTQRCRTTLALEKET